MVLEMREIGRYLHGGVVVLAVIAYSVYLFGTLNQSMTGHFNSLLEKELSKNPTMKKDYENYVNEIRLEQERKKQLAEFEAQAKRIQEQIKALSEAKEPSPNNMLGGITEELTKILQQSEKVGQMEKKLTEFKGTYSVSETEGENVSQNNKYVKFDGEL